jgi:sortase B
MKTRRSGWSIAAKSTDVANRVLDIILALFIILALLYSGYTMYDTWQVYNKGSNSDLLKYKPGSAEDSLSFSELQAINPDVCAWLTVDDTAIDYPVVQGETNLTYINMDVFGEFSLTGSVFLDYRNSNDFSDVYSLLYAHHIEGNIMFGQLPSFLEDDFFESHTTGSLIGNGFSYHIQWFACIYTDAFNSTLFNTSLYGSEESKQSLVAYLKENADQYRELEISESDRIIGLSTCEQATTDGRVLLFGRMTLD